MRPRGLRGNWLKCGEAIGHARSDGVARRTDAASEATAHARASRCQGSLDSVVVLKPTPEGLDVDSEPFGCVQLSPSQTVERPSDIASLHFA